MHEQSSEQDSRVAPQDLLEESGRDDKAIANLVGYFDVLIQMDLEQKSKERKQKDE